MTKRVPKVFPVRGAATGALATGHAFIAYNPDSHASVKVPLAQPGIQGFLDLAGITVYPVEATEDRSLTGLR